MDLYIPGRAHEKLGTERAVLVPEHFSDPKNMIVDADFENNGLGVVHKNYIFDPPTSSIYPWHQKQWENLCDLRKVSLTNYGGQEKLDLIIERVRAGDYRLYTRLIRPTFTFAPLHAKFCELMEALLFKHITHGMLSCGPRLGKSTLMCLLVTFIYGLSKGKANSLYTTYGADLTVDFGNEILNTVIDPVFRNLFPAAKLCSDSKAKKRFEFENGGKFFASSVGGVLTGKGAGTMSPNEFGGISVIDDPVKEMSEAISPTKMNRLHSWYTNEFNTRGNSNVVQLLTGTRYGVNDLHAYCLKTQEDGSDLNLYDKETNPTGKWVYLNIQTLCLNEEHDPLGRKIGESAWEEMIPAAVLYEKMDDPDQFSTFWALFQGNPQSKRGGIFKPWYMNIWDNPASLKVDYLFMSIDPSFGIGRDETALTIFGVTKDRDKCIVITQESSALWEFPELVIKVKQYSRQWNISKVVIEGTATGKPLYQTIIKELTIDAILINVAGRNKQERLSFILPYFKEDKSNKNSPPVPPRVYFLTGLYITRLRYQLTNFPFVAKDDLVDSLVIGATYFRDHLYMRFDYEGDMIDSDKIYEPTVMIELEELKKSYYISTLMDFGIIPDDDLSLINEVMMEELGVSAMNQLDNDDPSFITRDSLYHQESSYGLSIYDD